MPLVSLAWHTDPGCFAHIQHPRWLRAWLVPMACPRRRMSSIVPSAIELESKVTKQMWSRRTRDMLDAKHPASVNVHKLRCLECTAQDHSQDTHAMQRLCPGPKQYDKCSLCDVVLSSKGTGCNVSKAQWTRKRHSDRLCRDCVANKRARWNCTDATTILG